MRKKESTNFAKKHGQEWIFSAMEVMRDSWEKEEEFTSRMGGIKMDVSGIYVVVTMDDKGRRYVNIYAADNDSRISDFMLSEAIERIVDISTDYVSLSDAVVDGEELVYEMLTDEEIKNLRGE